MDAAQILLDAAGRPAETARGLADHLSSEVLNAHPGGHPNSAAWLLWHTGREIDVQVAEMTGGDQVWTQQGFAERTGLASLGDAMGYGMDADEARAVRTDDAAALLDYLDAATESLTAYLRTLDADALSEVVDEQWDPPVTRGARLVSVIDDAAQHVGQIAYIAGMPHRS